MIYDIINTEAFIDITPINWVPKSAPRPRRTTAAESVDGFHCHDRHLWQVRPGQTATPRHPHLVGATSRPDGDDQLEESRRGVQPGGLVYEAFLEQGSLETAGQLV